MTSKKIGAVSLIKFYKYQNERFEGPRLLRFSSLKSSLKPLGWLKPHCIESLHGVGKSKVVNTKWITWRRWPSCPYMIKRIWNSLSQEMKGRWPWNLVLSIGDSGSSWFIQMITLHWLWDRHGGTIGRASALWPRGYGFDPGWVIPKTLKMLLAALSLGAKH